MAENPYEAPEQSSDSKVTLPPQSVRMRFAILAGAVGTCLPFSYGVWLVYSVWSQEVPPPDQVLDGTPAFVGFVIIVLGCPLAGIIFAAIGATAGHIRDTIALRHYMAMLNRSSKDDANSVNRTEQRQAQ